MAYCIILSTCASQKEADKIAALLLEQRIASCVQMKPIISHYHWKGNISRSKEIHLLIKTTDSHYSHVESLIRENHSYEVPEIVKLPISDGFEEYLSWISRETDTKEIRS